MKCLCCDKKLKEINSDSDYNNWKRKYHKKCWNERFIYLDIIEKCKKQKIDNIEFYKKKACIF